MQHRHPRPAAPGPLQLRRLPVGQILGAGGLDHSRCTRTSTAAPVEIPLRVSM
jgi:hypothetical protein